MSLAVAMAVAVMPSAGSVDAERCICLRPTSDATIVSRMPDRFDGMVIASGVGRRIAASGVVTVAVAVERSYWGPAAGSQITLVSASPGGPPTCSYTEIEPETRHLLALNRVGTGDNYLAAICTSYRLDASPGAVSDSFLAALERVAPLADTSPSPDEQAAEPVSQPTRGDSDGDRIAPWIVAIAVAAPAMGLIAGSLLVLRRRGDERT